MKKGKWTPHEDSVLMAMARTHTCKEIGLILDRPHRGVHERCIVLGITKKSKKIVWTAAMDDLAAVTPPNQLMELAETFGIPIGLLHARRKALRKAGRGVTTRFRSEKDDEEELKVVHRWVDAANAEPLEVSAPRSIFDLEVAS